MSTLSEENRRAEAATAAAPAGSKEPLEKPAGGRLVSLDAFRGFIMAILISNGFGLIALADDPKYGWLGRQFDHVPWKGMVFWDLIQPAFMFMVGLAMPFSFAGREVQGESFRRQFGHVIYRFFMLMLISQVLMSITDEAYPRYVPHFQLDNVLVQIAITYVLCFLIMQLEFRWQLLAAILVLALHWGLFVVFPGKDGPFSMTDNIGRRIDAFILGQNPAGYYVSINSLSSTFTTLLGVWVGQLLRRRKAHTYNLAALTGGAAICFALGGAIMPVDPMIKRIWTDSFSLVSGGCVLLILLFFYWLVEIAGFRRMMFPLVVLGTNSIFIYCVYIVFAEILNDIVGTFTRGYPFLGILAPVAQMFSVFLVMWYLCYWLYQRGIFFKI
jgi:heparan-alpha-glucosaminide N-acetyltransferase